MKIKFPFLKFKSEHFSNQMPVYEDTKQQFEKTFESCVSYFKRVCATQQKKKTKEMKENTLSLIKNISELYDQLYQLSSAIQDSKPNIKNGEELEESLQFYFVQTTAPKMKNFIVILDLLKIVLENFVNILKGETGQISKEKAEKTIKKLQDTQQLAENDLTNVSVQQDEKVIDEDSKINLIQEITSNELDSEKKDSFFSIKNGKKIIDPDFSQRMFKDYGALYVCFGSKENTLKVIVPNEEAKNSIEKDFENKIEVEIKIISKGIEKFKLSTRANSSDDQENCSNNIGTIGMILESDNGTYYALTSAHAILNTKENPTHEDCIKSFNEKKYHEHISCEILDVSFEVMLSSAVIMIDKFVDFVLIPIDSYILIEKLNKQSKFEIKPETIPIDKIKGMKVVKYGKATNKTLGTLNEFGNTTDLSSQYIISSSYLNQNFAEKGDSGSCCYLYQSVEENVTIIPLGMLNESDGLGNYFVSTFDMITTSITDKTFKNFICLHNFLEFKFRQ
jgi:hypothetical protein